MNEGSRRSRARRMGSVPGGQCGTSLKCLGRSRLFRRLKRGAHGQLVELYAARLVKDGLARQGTWRCLSLVGDLLSWIARRRSTVADLDERMVERYLRGRARKQSIQPGDRAALKRLLSVCATRA